ncbi:hypothetical protein H6F38_23090 [Paenibacillus sp. EKM208P]|nr:hypothetical protein H6F38_23090 [Paenibacillus sp. EKM208P]
MTPNTWAIREVALATFYDKKTGKAKIQLQNLKTSGIENTATTVYAMGGRGNNRIVGFSGDRGGKVSLQDAIFTNEVIAMMTGNDIKSGQVPIKYRDVLEVNGDKATLKFTPATPVNGLNSVYTLTTDQVHEEEIEFSTGTLGTKQYTITGKELSFKAGEFADGTKIVAYYTTQSGTSAKQITISSDKFAGSYELILDCLIRDTVTKQDFAAQIQIFDAKMEDNWNLTMAAEGDPSVFDIPIEILKPVDRKETYVMTIYDEDELV